MTEIETSNFYSPSKFINFLKDKYVNNKFEINNKTSSNKMYLLIIEFEQKTYLDLNYYPLHVLECDNQHNIEQIRNQFKVEFDNSDLRNDVF